MFGVKNFEQARKNVESARNRLAEVAAGSALRELSNAVNAVAHAEGVAEVFGLVELMERNGASEVVISLELGARMGNGADDSWSGRGNDVQRAKHDGFRDAAQNIIRASLYRMEEAEEAKSA